MNNLNNKLTEAIEKLTEEMTAGMLEFAQKLVQTPSISGTEKALSDLNLAEMNKLGYDEVFRDDHGNVVGLVSGTEPGPTIIYNSHMDHVSPGDVLSIYMEEKGYEHVSDMVGLALRNMVPTDQLDRDTIVYPIVNKLDCIGCGRFYISCYDAGHQAIRWNDAERLPHLAAKKCVGCHLCLHVCPAGAIDAGKRMPKPQAVHSG